METIILAGGLGTRLRAVLDSDIPKPMAPVQGRPFLEYLLDMGIEQGIDRFILAVHHQHHVIQNHFGRSYKGARIDYSIDDRPFGTGGALLLAARMVHQDPFLVQNGDTLFSVDLQGLMNFHREKQADLTIALNTTHDPKRYMGITQDTDDRITALEARTDATPLSNGGTYVINQNLLERYPWDTQTPLSLEDQIFPHWMRNGKKVYGMVSDAAFIDIGIPEDYALFLSLARTKFALSDQKGRATASPPLETPMGNVKD